MKLKGRATGLGLNLELNFKMYIILGFILWIIIITIFFG